MLKLNHFVQLTPQINQLLNHINSLNQQYQHLPLTTTQQDHLRRRHILNSAIYSAKIEGNPLTPDTYHTSQLDLSKLEVQNLFQAYTWISQQTQLQLNLDLIRLLHQKSMQHLHVSAGSFRQEISAIYNSAGIAIYLTPPPNEIKPLLSQWLTLIQNSNLNPLIQAIISHYQFEKIHPFIDGNGRVGRLLFTIMLQNSDYQYIHLLGIEKLIEQSKQTYYDFLNLNQSDLTDFTLYFLELIKSSLQQLISQLSSPHSIQTSSNLSPRRQEIFNIIKDHSPCSANFIYRRFLNVPQSTIRYDLKQLQNQGLIRKLGTTRGALYSI